MSFGLSKGAILFKLHEHVLRGAIRQYNDHLKNALAKGRGIKVDMPVVLINGIDSNGLTDRSAVDPLLDLHHRWSSRGDGGRAAKHVEFDGKNASLL